MIMTPAAWNYSGLGGSAKATWLGLEVPLILWLRRLSLRGERGQSIGDPGHSV